MQIPCVYRDYTFYYGNAVYICEFSQQKIPEDVQIIPNGLHQREDNDEEKNNNDVVGVMFYKCDVIKVPKGLTRIFPNMKILSICDSTLKIVTKNDLAEYENIERIGFCRNNIKYLPGDLFKGFKNLEDIGFNGNNLELIGANILDGLDKLKHVSFEKNPRYNLKFSQFSQSNVTLEEVKALLADRFDNYHTNPEDNLNNIEFDVKNFLQTDDTLKDFHIQINDQKFAVYKILLAARSPTLAEMLRNNPEVKNLNLTEIPVEIFEIAFSIY